jgi:hypothetical protein
MTGITRNQEKPPCGGLSNPKPRTGLKPVLFDDGKTRNELSAHGLRKSRPAGARARRSYGVELMRFQAMARSDTWRSQQK